MARALTKARRRPRGWGKIRTLPSGRFPNLVSLAAEFSKSDRDEQFELLIDIFVDGLARLAEAG